MSRSFEVLGRMFVLGTVTAPHMAAGKAHTQIHPGIAHCNTFRADRDVLRVNVFDLIQMGAGDGRHGGVNRDHDCLFLVGNA